MKRYLKKTIKTQNLHLELLNFKDIATETKNNTVLLHFNDYLQVTYIKKKEPVEYASYETHYLKFRCRLTGKALGAGGRSWQRSYLTNTSHKSQSNFQ